MNDNILNKKWNNFFNWTILYPIIFLLTLVLVFTICATIIFSGDYNIVNSTILSSVATLGVMLTVLGSILGSLGLLFYLIWYFVAADTIFQLLGENRVAWNILNIILFIFSGFLIMPIILWFKLKGYWGNKSIMSNWKAVI